MCGGIGTDAEPVVPHAIKHRQALQHPASLPFNGALRQSEGVWPAESTGGDDASREPTPSGGWGVSRGASFPRLLASVRRRGTILVAPLCGRFDPRARPEEPGRAAHDATFARERRPRVLRRCATWLSAVRLAPTSAAAIWRVLGRARGQALRARGSLLGARSHLGGRGVTEGTRTPNLSRRNPP